MKTISGKNKKIAVISGGTGYLGSFIARELIASGIAVVAIDKSKGKNKFGFGRNALMHFINVDISDSQAVKNTSEKVLKKFGKISIIIHAASAPLIRKPVLTGSRDDFESQFLVNVTGAFNIFKYFCPNIVSSGIIIGILSSSIITDEPLPSSGSYIPSKYALRGLLRLLSIELRDKSIKVCGVAPAFMSGGLNSNIPEIIKELIRKKSNSNEITTPEEVAKAILNLINDEPQNINGKFIDVPGGNIINL